MTLAGNSSGTEAAGGAATQDPGELAEHLLARLSEASRELRAAALFDASGVQLAATDEADWSAGAAALWRAVGAAQNGSGLQVHVGTEEGEVFAVRGPAGSIVATSERFALASLMLCDLRATLRELERGRGER